MSVILRAMLVAIIVISLAQAEEFQISYSCIDCHQDRYEEWSRSMHALAVKDPVFEAAYLRALQSDPKNRYYCLSCHSPTTKMTNDFNLSKSITVEGVTCTFCHTVTGLENSDYIFKPGNPMQGPYNDSRTGAHASVYNELHTKSEFCAGCHEFSINNVPVYETYTEWKEGPYAAEESSARTAIWRHNRVWRQRTGLFERRFTGISGTAVIRGCSLRRLS